MKQLQSDFGALPLVSVSFSSALMLLKVNVASQTLPHPAPPPFFPELEPFLNGYN